MLDGLLWWTGSFVWACAMVYMLHAWWELAKGFVRAASWIRWRWKLCKTNGLPVRWWTVPRTFLHIWYRLSFVEAETVKWAGPGGYWDGYGKWHVYPKADAEKTSA